MSEPADDLARVRVLLGREPRGAFEVVTRDPDGDPVVIYEPKEGDSPARMCSIAGKIRVGLGLGG